MQFSPDQWHARSAAEALSALDTTPDGLTSAEAERRLSRFGPNELTEAQPVRPVMVFLAQFQSPLIYILLVAALLSFASNHPLDGAVILAIVILNAAIGFFQEYRAERALEALKKLSAPGAAVIRDGRETEIDAANLVPGYIVILEVGDRVPADARLISVANLKTDESALTGESTSVSKRAGPLPPETSLADRINMVYSGTTVAYGRGVAVVTATGMATEIGHIAGQVAAEPRGLTPVQRKLARLGSALGLAGLLIAVAIILAGLIRRLDLLDMFFLGVAAAVSFIPEGLPAVITVVLSVGMQRMARRCAVVRKLPAVEALGSATVICSDKTGTLTKNEMTVETGYVGEMQFTVTGEGYKPEGDFYLGGRPVGADEQDDLKALFTAFVLCSDARLHMEDGAWRVLGDPTEGALVVAAEKLGLRKHDLEGEQPRIDEVPFDSELRYMATLHRAPDGRKVAYVKGAPEKLLGMCDRYRSRTGVRDLTSEGSSGLMAWDAEMAANALRVLAAAYKELPPDAEVVRRADVESGLIYLGAVGMIDPPREEARQAISDARRAGIRTIMITGDHPDTARTVAELLGLLEEGGRVITGRELNDISDEEMTSTVGRIAVFARAEPEHKIRLVRALRERGHIVAMTGDGVNDAPALKLADIGIAMGITGTDVAKEASDMVLLDDNYATIVSAVREGRGIYSNIRKVVTYLLSTNTGEVLVYLSTILAGLPIPLLPVQILWINLVTDGFPTLPISLEPREPGILSEPPRNPREPIVTKHMAARIFFMAALMFAGVLGVYLWGLGMTTTDRARTLAFVTMALFQMFNVYNVRSERLSLFRIGIWSNPYIVAGMIASVIAQVMAVHLPFFNTIFRTVPLSLADWGLVVLVSSSIFIAEEVRKALAPNLFTPRETRIARMDE